MNKIVINWVKTSNYDLQTADAMYKAARYLYVVFMCHLAIEKMLKAILAYSIRRTSLLRYTISST